MSATSPPPPSLTSIANNAAAARSPSFAQNLSSLGLGYAIAIALGILVLLSVILLASYVCCRSAAARRRRRGSRRDENRSPDHSAENSVYLPRVIFVSEEDENEPQNDVVGLDEAVINSYPKLVYTKGNGTWGNDTLCSICLCEYRESEVLRMLPDCKHCFHVTCVDAWLKLNASCPVCRSSPLPTPLSTPLQEVVPLSQFSDGRRRQ